MNDDFDKLLGKFADSQYLADIFHVLHFDELNTLSSTDQRDPTRSIQLLVPACLDTLFTEDTPEATAILEALVIWARPETRKLSKPARDLLITRIRDRYSSRRAAGYVTKLDDDEKDHEIRRELELLLPSNPIQQQSVIEKMKKTARTAIGTVLTVSKNFGRPILTRGRALSKFLRDRITQVEFPSRVTKVLEEKRKIFGRFDPFKGRENTKYFVCLAVHIGGGVATGGVAPTLHAGAIALHIVDP